MPRYVRVLAWDAGAVFQGGGVLALQVAGARWSARADRAVSQARPVVMLVRWNSPPRLTIRRGGTCPRCASDGRK
jgi:hypothetical protein